MEIYSNNYNPIKNLKQQPNKNKRAKESIENSVKHKRQSMRLRTFWKEQFLNMSEKEMKKYANDPRNPYAFRVFCQMFLEDTSFENFYRLAEQTEGKLKESVEITNLPPINLDVFGIEDEDKPEDS